MSTITRNLGRIRQVINVATKYGFLRIIKKIGLINLVTMKPTKFEVEGDEPVRVRKMLEELGPTYVKIGQVLSMRPDLIPPEYVKELSQLYDKASPLEFEKIRNRVEAELGKGSTFFFTISKNVQLVQLIHVVIEYNKNIYNSLFYFKKKIDFFSLIKHTITI